MSQVDRFTDGMLARHRPLDRFWTGVVVVMTTLGIALTINQLFNFRLFMNVTILENRYLYLLLGIFLSQVFIVFPAGKRVDGRVPWYDVVCFFLALGTTGYLAWHALRIVLEAWEFRSPPEAIWIGAVLALLLLEAARRSGGLIFTALIVLFALYPVYAGEMPDFLSGYNLSLAETIGYHTMGVEAILGIPMRVFGTLFVGFLIFGVALQATGGGKFFTDLAVALLGQFRGGAAKVAILASAFFGSMSGSAISNVLSTGQATIPTMVRTGFSRSSAAAIEANASSAGTVMPPVMAATAFLIAAILNVPYYEVALAAAVPILLYFISLFLQLDAYAAKYRIRGVSREELPSLWGTLKGGWFYLFAFATLIYLMFALQREALAPFYATGVLLVLAMFRKETRWTRERLVNLMVSSSRLLSEIVAILAAVGFLIGSLSVTGLAPTLASNLVIFAGDNLLLLVIMGAVACFILGMGMTITAAYVFLAITMAPALIQAGMNAMAVHLFILYWASLSNVTPPVGLAVVAASGIAGSRLMPAMMESVRFATVKYLLPFFFIYNPILVLQDFELFLFIRVLGSALIGVTVVAYALQGYLPFAGAIRNSVAGGVIRAGLVFGALMLIFPEPVTTAAGLAIVVVLYGLSVVTARTGWLPLVEERVAP